MPAKKQTLTQLTKLLNQIRSLDKQQVEAQFQIANTLTAIKDHRFFEQANYTSFEHMVHCELEFNKSTASRYCALYHHYVTWKYNKKEFLSLMQKFGWRRVEEALRGTDRKMGYRAITNRLAIIDENDNQFNFNLHDKRDAARFTSLLERHGLETHKNGTRINLTTSMLALLDDYEALKARESSLPPPKKTHKKPALRSVS